MTPSRIEPATFGFVAQHLNHCATAVPKMQQLFRLLISLSPPYMFPATNSPIRRSTFDCIYSFWYNAPTMLQTGATVEMEVPSQP